MHQQASQILCPRGHWTTHCPDRLLSPETQPPTMQNTTTKAEDKHQTDNKYLDTHSSKPRCVSIREKEWNFTIQITTVRVTVCCFRRQSEIPTMTDLDKPSNRSSILVKAFQTKSVMWEPINIKHTWWPTSVSPKSSVEPLPVESSMRLFSCSFSGCSFEGNKKRNEYKIWNSLLYNSNKGAAAKWAFTALNSSYS